MDNIAVIRLSHLGDVILAEPVVSNLLFNFPNCNLTFFTREEYRPVVEMFNSVDRIVAFNYDNKHKNKTAVVDKINGLNIDFDLVLDIHKVPRSSFIRKKLRAAKKITYTKNSIYRRWSVLTKNHRIEKHTLDRYFEPLEKNGISIQSRLPGLNIPEKSVLSAGKILAEKNLIKDEFVVLAVGASQPAKHYPIPQFVDLARLIMEKYNLNIMVVEKEDFDYLNLFDDLKRTGKLVMGISYDLKTLAAVLSMAKLTVSNDSGVMHLAAASGTPAVGLYGPTHPVLGFSPVGQESMALTVDEKCSPCSLHGERLCYRDEQYCFTKLTPGLILDKSNHLLRNS